VRPSLGEVVRYPGSRATGISHTCAPAAMSSPRPRRSTVRTGFPVKPYYRPENVSLLMMPQLARRSCYMPSSRTGSALQVVADLAAPMLASVTEAASTRAAEVRRVPARACPSSVLSELISLKRQLVGFAGRDGHTRRNRNRLTDD
jgi:hypothetical protein